MSAEELADPRLISTTDFVSDLASEITDTLLAARDDTLERLNLEYGDTPLAGVSNFDSVARTSVNNALSLGNIERQARPIMEDAIRRTYDRMNSSVHSPRVEERFTSFDRQNIRFFARNVELSTRNAAEDMFDRMRNGVRHGAMRSETMDIIDERVREEFSRNNLNNRARLIAHMEIQTAVQSTKLGAYENHEDIDGVQVINSCGEGTVPLCADLAGCESGENAIAWFDEGDVASQLQDQVSDDKLFEGFSPLPQTPPYHFGCSTELGPAIRNQT